MFEKSPAPPPVSISSVEASHAKTSATQESVPASTASAPGFGQNMRESFAHFDPATSSWKTSQRSLLVDLEEFSLTWPRSGSMRNGICFERAKWARPISANDFSSWPTPTVHGNHNRKGATENSGDGLSTAVKAMWSTPVASEGTRGSKGRKTGTGADIASHPDPEISARGLVLNPQFVEAMQGFPDEWTAFDASEMRLFRRLQRSRGKP